MEAEVSLIAASEGRPRIASKPQELEEGGRIFPYRFQREHGHATTLILDWLSEL